MFICSRLASTDEQAKHGLSIEAQLYNLREWAQKNGHIVVGEYVDAGISGKKPPSKRPDLSRFFDDVENGLEVDILAFTKLDRFFRSVKLYYQAVDVLDRHKIAWQAIHENYETVTSGGRLRVNLMLSIGEQEADRTSERIKDVFERKIANGECVNPHGLPRGYSVVDKKVVPNEEADAIRAAFAFYERSGSIRATVNYLHEELDFKILYKSLQTLLKNRLYIGEYRGNTSYCEPIIDRELFERAQRELQNRSVRFNQNRRVYLFSGLIYCGNCAHALVGVHADSGDYMGYRCQRAALNHRCVNRSHLNERKLEAYLLDHIAPELDLLIQQQNKSDEYVPKSKPRKKKTIDIQPKLDRLKDLYVDGLIDKAQYLSDREKIIQSIKPAADEPPRHDYTKLKELLDKDFRTRYDQLTRENKRVFWRSLISRIEWDADRNLRFYFKT